jgi:tetratricopeptide (TPR) repeat protein
MTEEGGKAMNNVGAHDNIEEAYRDPLDGFTDREQTVALFEQFLSSAQPGSLRVLAIKGNSGTGKTFLISFLVKYVCLKRGWHAGIFSVTRSGAADFRSFVAGLEDALKGCVQLRTLRQYRLKRDDFSRRFDEYCSAVMVGHVEQTLSASNAASVSGISMNVQVTTELRRREAQLRSELTRALVELAEESEHPLYLFIDNYEYLTEAESELNDWLFGELLPRLASASRYAVRVVTCGWMWPDDAANKSFAYCTQLDDFALEQVKDYLEKHELFPSTATTTEQQALTSAFYALSKGHPLVLRLAVTYFKQLGEQERTARHLLEKKPLVDEGARVEFLEERLLQRLPEPHRTLLERGPILRVVEQGTLQALLSLSPDDPPRGESGLDDRTYSHFLGYPFLQHTGGSVSSSAQVRYRFHELVRQVRLAALRQRHPQSEERLHRRMIEHYEQLGVSLNGKAAHGTHQSEAESDKRWMMQEEMLYHALQVQELRETAFQRWTALTEHALLRWDHWRSGTLLELVRQLAEEGEAFFCKEDAPYGFYLIQHAHFLRQKARWGEAKEALGQAVQLFEERGHAVGLARVWQELGDFYLHQGKLDDALASYERALAVQTPIDGPPAFATVVNGIGAIHLMRGEFKEALACFEQVMALEGQSGNTDVVAAAIHNMGAVYREQGHLELALHYFEQALTLRERIGVPADIATSLNTIGGIYDARGESERALAYYEQALQLREQIGNPIAIATSLNNMGIVYKMQGKLEQSLHCHERALLLREQIGNPIDIANSCNNIAHLYIERLGATFVSGIPATSLPEQEVVSAIESFKKALSLYEGLGQGFEPEVAHELEALAFCSILSNNIEQAVTYAKRAKTIRKKIHQAAECRTIAGNMSDFFTLVAYPLLDRLTEKRARRAFETPLKFSRRRKKYQKRKREGRKR